MLSGRLGEEMIDVEIDLERAERLARALEEPPPSEGPE